MEDDYVSVTECKICGNTGLKKYFDFGDMPLVNVLEDPLTGIKTKKFPLAVNFCENCSLSQLTISVNPKILFQDYPYRSSISKTFGEHCEKLAVELNETILSEKNDLVVDIASNDGFTLSFFKNKHNKVLGIDPAKNLAKIANDNGIETIAKFWNEELAEEVLRSHGSAKVITAFNVFAHVPNMKSFTKGVKKLLDKEGYFIIESPHIQTLIENFAFDTIYHEHVSYLSAKSVINLMNDHDLRVAKIIKTDLHGGSIRFYIEQKDSPDTSDGSVQKIVEEEKNAGIHSLDTYYALQKNANQIKQEFMTMLNILKNSGKKVVGFAASAKGNVLLNYCGITNEYISHIFDDTPEKQGLLSPGTNIPIISRDRLNEINPDYMILLAWNFAKELMNKTIEFKEKGGQYIIPIPRLTLH